jgi:hypothetical protein
MKVSVNCSVTYSFEVDVPEMVTDLPCYVDSCDPVYSSICKVLTEKGLNFEGAINSIVDEDTEKVLYDM